MQRGNPSCLSGHLPWREGKVYGWVLTRLQHDAILYFLPCREGGLKGRMGSGETHTTAIGGARKEAWRTARTDGSPGSVGANAA